MGLCVLMVVQAQATGLGIRGYYWAPILSGEIGVDGDNRPGDNLDFTDTLGLEKATLPVFEVYAGVANQSLSVAYSHARNSGTRTTPKDISFDGELYPAKDIISSELRLTVYDITYGYNLIATPIIELGLLSQAKYIEGSIGLSSALKPARREKSFQSPIPMLGVNLRLGLLNFLEIGGAASGGYAKAKAFEGRAELVFKPVPLLGIHGGYRTQRCEVDDDQVHLKLDDSGPYLALTLGF